MSCCKEFDTVDGEKYQQHKQPEQKSLDTITDSTYKPVSPDTRNL